MFTCPTLSELQKTYVTQMFQNIKRLFDKIENNVGKGENGDNHRLLLCIL